MSENKINEDNCVLHDIEFWLIYDAFKEYKKQFINTGFENRVSAINKVFQKINKLNDLAKVCQKK